MNCKNTAFNMHTQKRIDIKSKEDIEWLGWIGMNVPENIELIEQGKLLFFEEHYCFEGVAIYDTKNNQCIVIEYRGI